MKTLLIMRHAKSSWDDQAVPDRERPLKPRGERDAPHMGELLRRESLVPQAILASTAVRARMTADLVAEACGFEGDIDFQDGLYGAAAEACLDVLRGLPDAVQTALLVAHNPGLEELVTDLTGENEHLGTSTIAHIELDIQHWSDLADETEGRLKAMWRPRETT